MIKTLPLGKQKISVKILYIAGVLLIALFLRLHCINSFSFWYDEASHLVDNRSVFHIPPVHKFFDANFTVKNHDFLMLYDLGFIYYWKKIVGVSERNLRFSSLLFSMLSIIFVYKIGQKYFSEKTAYIAIALTMLSPFHIYYSQELRPYAAIGFVSLVVIYSFINYLNLKKTRYLCLYIVSSVINIYAHFTTIILTCAIIAYLFITFKKNKQFLLRLMLAHCLILALIFPAGIIIIHHLKLFLSCNLENLRIVEYPVWLGKVKPIHILNTLKNMSIGYNLDYRTLAGKTMTILYSFLFCFGVFKYKKKEEAKILMVCFLMPLLMVFIISQIKTCYVDRYFFPESIVFILGVAIGLSRIKGKILIVLLIVIIGINGMALKNYYNNTYPDSTGINNHYGISEKIDIRPLVNYLVLNYKDGDIILHTRKLNVFPLKYYVSTITRNVSLKNICDQGIVIDYDQANNNFTKLEYSGLHPYINKMEKFDIRNAVNKLDRVWIIKFEDDDQLIEYFKSNGYEQIDYKIFNRNKLYYFITTVR